MHLLFDLDGTLTDPFPGITKCIQHSLMSLGIEAPPATDLRWCIGPPLPVSFAELLATADEALVDQAIVKYRDRFSEIGIYENDVYESMYDVLQSLNESGHMLCVATSKPKIYADRIVDHFKLRPYFYEVYGSELDGVRADKGQLIEWILKRDCIHPADALMIGDREHDIAGARKNKVDGIGVLWGYGSEEELEAAGAISLATQPVELLATLSEAAATRSTL